MRTGKSAKPLHATWSLPDAPRSLDFRPVSSSWTCILIYGSPLAKQRRCKDFSGLCVVAEKEECPPIQKYGVALQQAPADACPHAFYMYVCNMNVHTTARCVPIETRRHTYRSTTRFPHAKSKRWRSDQNAVLPLLVDVSRTDVLVSQARRMASWEPSTTLTLQLISISIEKHKEPCVDNNLIDNLLWASSL